ncbi:thiopeptide-type bacteriocin biosynthesis protein [Streptomyces sp. V4I23]|uniref:lantibiotic dehydratase n=1 Tax=Streptomyces sp. V4I23 TaxID=3042282 RepID=UPI00278839E6|nr:lantibiotic dehydratase [Streptomyces sp. V4I23]MDQ1006664.1 thiopeptide-type bacteriocin biosynthesis protein [Streptomyces sp. V4I23]
MYRAVDAAAVRTAAWDDPDRWVAWPDLTGPDAGPDRWRAWLHQVWETDGFPVAVTAASPDLADRVRQIRDGLPVPAADVRRTVLAVLRYLLRANGRATPFGLFAGVAGAHYGATPAMAVGSGHHAAARPDAATVNALVARFEADPALRPHQMLFTSALAVERDGHVVVEHRPPTTLDGAPDQVRVRLTGPVREALDGARSPIRWSELAAALSAAFPRAAAAAVDKLLAGLVEQRILLTGLRPPMTASDPLAALLDHVETYAPEQAPALRATPRPAFDLRVDCDLTIPQTVAREAEAAARALTRLAPRAALSGWSEWHERFLDRYGPRAVVPVLDAIDALGYPAGYRGAPDPAPSPLPDRDSYLLKLAYRAAMQRRREVVLDDAMIEELATADVDRPVQPSTELTVRIHAASLPALERGDFALHVTGVARSAGATTGRFLSLLSAADRRRMSRAYAALPGLHQGALLAQISSTPLSVQGQNVARAPRTTSVVIPVGDYAGPETGVLPMADVAVTADAERLHLVSLSRNRAVHTLLLNAVDLTRHTHPLARFLAEAPVALAVACTGFQWGTAASALPFLPGLRYGRTVLSPARWLLTDTDLPAATAPWPQWDTALSYWRHEVNLPKQVYLSEADQTLALDLAEPAHRAVLRAHLDRHRTVTLRAAPQAQDLGWAGGRAHEVVIPLATDQRIPPVPTVSGHVVDRDHGQLPGCDDRLYLQLHGHRDRQDAILTRHLPDLLHELGGARWWFIRYPNPADHLRLRLTCAPGTVGAAIEKAGAWAQQLRRRGLITHLTVATHLPETARFGGPAAAEAAEAYFVADSAAAVAQLAAQTTAGPDARALTAASMVDIAAGLLGGTGAAMDWLIERTRTHRAAPPRAVYRQAVDLATGNPASLGEHVTAAWAERRAALAHYRHALADTALRPEEVLADLLHLHHVRMRGPGLDEERGHLHLARAAALSWTARARRTP